MNDDWQPTSGPGPGPEDAPRPPVAAAVASRRRIIGLVTAGLLLSAALGAVVGGLAAMAVVRGNVIEAPPDTVSNVLTTRAVQAAAQSGSIEDDVVAVVREARPAVVTVYNMRAVRRQSRGAAEMLPASSGSGVIFDPRGYIATNYHVIQGNQGLEVMFLDGRRTAAEVVGYEPDYDVAILQVAAQIPAVAPLADSSLLEAGMHVLAIGSPLGGDYQNTVTYGIVAGLNRTVTVPQTRFDRGSFRLVEVDQPLNAAPLIQTDAAINNGNSGGPLVDLQGRVVGLNTLVVRGTGRSPVEGLGFAVPSNVVRALADEWIDGRSRPALGIRYVPITPDAALELNMPRAGGALVRSVEPSSAAETAALQAGDVVVALDGIQLDLDHALTDLLWRYRAGDEVVLTVRRGTKTFDSRVKLGAYTKE